MQVFHNHPERLILEHLIDNLAESMLGVTNLELKKNITIDVFDSDSDTHLRDSAGFIVTDRLQFEQVTVASKELLAVLESDPGTSYEKIVRRFGAGPDWSQCPWYQLLSPNSRGKN